MKKITDDELRHRKLAESQATGMEQEAKQETKQEIKQEAPMISVDDLLESDTKHVGEIVYLCKYEGLSYLHVSWKTEEEIYLEGQATFQKLKRYQSKIKKKYDYMIPDSISIEHEDNYFNPHYLHVERILYTHNMFPIIHPKTYGKKILGTWREDLIKACEILMNY
jgi:hypothetical protein